MDVFHTLSLKREGMEISIPTLFFQGELKPILKGSPNHVGPLKGYKSKLKYWPKRPQHQKARHKEFYRKDQQS